MLKRVRLDIVDVFSVVVILVAVTCEEREKM